MSKNKYFRSELAFLKESGVEFAKIYPHMVQFLDGSVTDPDVERLLEGFAFLTGRLREKLEDEFPELTHSLIHMLWPNYLRPTPSVTIVQFAYSVPENQNAPDDKHVSDEQHFPEQERSKKTEDKASTHSKQRVEQGFTLYADAVADGVICQFHTCRDVTLYPIQRDSVTSTHTRDASTIDIDLSTTGNAHLHTMQLEDLRFYLSGDSYSAQMLYLWLNHYLKHIEIIGTCPQSGDTRTYRLPKRQLKPVGFATEDALLPYPDNVFEGYRILQEYLSYEQAFLFFDITQIMHFITQPLDSKFRIRFCFSMALPADVRVRDNSFELFCTPAINLFEHDASPTHLNGKHTQYPILPGNRERTHYEIFSVNHVESWQDPNKPKAENDQKRIYTPFESFHHETERTNHRTALYYRVRVQESPHQDGFDHTLSFVRGDETDYINTSETVSISVLATNRQLPLQLGRGSINPKINKQTFASCTNITVPTAPLHPTLDGSLLWTLISNLSLNYLSLLSKDALCCILRAYDFKALVDRQSERIAKQRLEGIVDVQSKPVERLIKGLPVRGLQSVIRLNPDNFGSEGDLYLFGTSLSHFLSLYANINSFHELLVINDNNQEKYTWGIKTGLQPLM